MSSPMPVQDTASIRMGVSASRMCRCQSNNDNSSYIAEDSSSSRSTEIEFNTAEARSGTNDKKSRDRPPGHTIRMIRRQNTSTCTCLSSILPKKFLCCLHDDEISMTKIERTMKATLLIQKWYRRYMARLEIRRRYTWTIFQSIEYAGEQDQARLYNFFNALLTHMLEPDKVKSESRAASVSSSIESMDMSFQEESDEAEDELLDIEDRDQGFHVRFPMVEEDLRKIIELYRKKRHYRLHAKYVAQILKESIKVLKRLPNLNVASIAISKQITVCGDLHGKLDDLLVIFHKNGLPSPENPYVFNGDFVDRGKRGLEVLLILLACLLVYPGGVYLNRGNHEDYIMNQRYGFLREVQSKYRKNSEKLMKLVEGVYRWLPLGTIVNNKVLIVHGGISDTTDLDLIRSLDRGKYSSLLRPPIADTSVPGGEAIDKIEWKQVFDILWSDPQVGDGCIPNQLRGAGTYFGPDVTKDFLERSRLIYIVRSHECKPDGYEVTHNNMVVTIFSASNYYELGSNKGAYLKLVGPQLDTHFVQYMAASARAKRLTFHQRIGLVESSAIKELHGQIMAKQDQLSQLFAAADPDGTGYISLSDWCVAMETGTNLGLPWRMLKEKLVNVDPETQRVKYSTTFENLSARKNNSVQGGSTVVETLYRNKASLEAIFRIIDKDNSGYITLDEFSDACNLIKQYMPNPITQEQCADICKLMDINKDGLVDLNEFLETFRLVDPERRKEFQARQQQSKAEAKEDTKPAIAGSTSINVEVNTHAQNVISEDKNVENSRQNKPNSPIRNSLSQKTEFNSSNSNLKREEMVHPSPDHYLAKNTVYQNNAIDTPVEEESRARCQNSCNEDKIMTDTKCKVISEGNNMKEINSRSNVSTSSSLVKNNKQTDGCPQPVPPSSRVSVDSIVVDASTNNIEAPLSHHHNTLTKSPVLSNRNGH